MIVREYHRTADPALWLRQIGQCDWRAGQYLCRLLHDDAFFSHLGEGSRLLLLTEGEELLAFCTYARQDEISAPELSPWAGFVYTFPAHRGRRRMGKLLEHVHRLAKAEGRPCVYISTEETGLYEKYGCVYWKEMPVRWGGVSRVYRLPVCAMDYSAVIGRQVCGVIDRPLGQAHPQYPELIYPLNYGYVEGIFAGDGEEQDVYVFGTDRPLRRFSGTVVGVYHRLNDDEDKWIVSLDGRPVPEETVLRSIEFQEQYYMGELYC